MDYQSSWFLKKKERRKVSYSTKYCNLLSDSYLSNSRVVIFFNHIRNNIFIIISQYNLVAFLRAALNNTIFWKNWTRLS